MTAYVIVDSAILDAKGLPAYASAAAKSLDPFDGRFLVRGEAPSAVKEGSWPADRQITMLEFPDIKHANDWYASEDYQKAIAVRQGVLELRMTFVDGAINSPE